MLEIVVGTLNIIIAAHECLCLLDFHGKDGIFRMLIHVAINVSSISNLIDSVEAFVTNMPLMEIIDSSVS